MKTRNDKGRLQNKDNKMCKIIILYLTTEKGYEEYHPINPIFVERSNNEYKETYILNENNYET